MYIGIRKDLSRSTLELKNIYFVIRIDLNRYAQKSEKI